jgi:hypothetical protein
MNANTAKTYDVFILIDVKTKQNENFLLINNEK